MRRRNGVRQPKNGRTTSEPSPTVRIRIRLRRPSVRRPRAVADHRLPFPLRTSEPKPGGRAIDISLLNVPVAAGREYLTLCLGRPQRQGQCHRLRGVCGRADIHVSEDQNSQIPGIAGWASLTVWTREPFGHPRCRVGIVSLGLALLADELACADRNDQRVDTWVQQRSVKHGLKVTLTASGVVRHEQGPWHQSRATAS